MNKQKMAITTIAKDDNVRLADNCLNQIKGGISDPPPFGKSDPPPFGG